MSERRAIRRLIEHGSAARALVHAASKGTLADLRWAIEHGAKVSVDALNAAARRIDDEQSLEMVRFLVESSDVDINEADCFGWTPLTHAVSSENMLLTRYLLDEGARDARVIGDAENTGNYPAGTSIRDIAEQVDEFQIQQGVAGPGQDEPGGFVKALDEAWGPAEEPTLAGTWRCISYQIDGYETPWREEDMGRGFARFDDDGTFVVDTMFRLEGAWVELSLEAGDTKFSAELVGSGRVVSIKFPDFRSSEADFALAEFSGAVFRFELEGDWR